MSGLKTGEGHKVHTVYCKKGVYSGVEIGRGYIVNSGIGSHTPCFSLDSASVDKQNDKRIK
jgi:hypothetical protein